jgi:hypothetical protein
VGGIPYATSVGKHVGEVLILYIDATRRGAGEEKVSCWDLSSAGEYLLLWEWEGRKCYSRLTVRVYKTSVWR